MYFSQEAKENHSLNMTFGGSRNSVLKGYPWFVIYSFKKLKEFTSFKYLKIIYAEEKPFLILLLWTILACICTLFVALPNTLLTTFNSLSQTFFAVFIPTLTFFSIYLWIGVILKYYDCAVSTKTFVVSCIMFEMFIEIAQFVYGPSLCFDDISMIVITILVGLLFVIISTGFNCKERKHIFTNFLLMSSIVGLRFLINGNKLFGWNFSSHPFLVYIYIIAGKL